MLVINLKLALMSKLHNKIIEITKEVGFSQKSSFKTMDKLYRESSNLKDIKQIFGKFIGEENIVHFASPRGVGKAFFLMQLCLCISSGQDSFIGEPIEKNGNTLYINLELNESVISRRLKKLMANMPFETKGEFHSFVFTTRNGLLDELPNLIYKIQEYKPVLIVIDNLRLAFVGSDLNSGSEVTKLMFALMAIRDFNSCAIVITDHFRKHTTNNLTDSDLHSGSGVKTDLSDADMFLRKSCQDKSYRLLKRCKSRNFEEDEKTRLLRLNPDTLWLELIDPNVNEAEHVGIKSMTDKNEQIDMAKLLREQGKSFEEIGQVLGKNKSTVSRWFKDEK